MKTILRAKDKQRHVEWPGFSLGDKGGKGTVPCGFSAKAERESSWRERVRILPIQNRGLGNRLDSSTGVKEAKPSSDSSSKLRTCAICI